jgi:alkaline phosphatase D
MRRRTFLTAAGGAGAALAASACAPGAAPVYPPQSGQPFEGVGTFPAGVGSGDPLPDSVLLWTRVHPELDTGSGVDVHFEVAATPAFREVVTYGTATADASTDHCVSIDIGGLSPGTTYWYRFRAGGDRSVIGRTRTAPVGRASERLRIAAFSCQRWTHGYFNSHADLAGLAEDPATDIDVVMSLGDYVYDTGYADDVYVPGRDDPVQDAATLADFRSKYRLYRSDPDLQAVHAAFPMINVFDNHDGRSDPTDPQGPAAVRAFFEHLPVRTRLPGRIDRSFRWGDLAELFVTDQRSFRDPELRESGVLGTSTEERPEILDPRRTMLGSDQREWLVEGLTSSTARWKVLGSQLMFWPWRSFGRLPTQPRGAGVYLNLTQWDGYAAERLAILDALAATDTRNTVVLSGDSHVFSAAQVSPDVDNRYAIPRVVEFGTGSVSSNNADENGYPTDDITWPILRAANPNHLRFFESERHGYAVIDLTPEVLTAELRSPRTIRSTGAPTDVLARFKVVADTQSMVRTG